MRNICRVGSLAVALSAPLCVPQTYAQQQNFDNAVALGYADIRFNTTSGDLTGPFTPDGVEVQLEDTRTLAFSYTHHLSGPWSLLFQAGVPPTVKINAAGTAAAVGKAGSAKAWFPAVLLTYKLPSVGPLRPYAGAGLNYTFFTDRKITNGYTTAFGGTSSSATLSDSLGGVVKLGGELPLSERWYADIAYTHYWIETKATVKTETSGVGSISRTLKVGANPDVFSLMIGYRF